MTSKSELWETIRLIVACLLLPLVVNANEVLPKVVVVTSYNPDTHSMSSHLHTFVNEYTRMGGRYHFAVESINSKNLSGLHEWKAAMQDVLERNTHAEKPELVIMMGQEAWATYLSLQEEWIKELPVVGMLISENTVLLPPAETELHSWAPLSISPFKDKRGHNIVGGVVYVYDIRKNIDLILDYFPHTRRIAFVSDNTYGGVAMQALFKKEMKHYPQLETILLDGRTGSFMEVSEEIRTLPDSTCLLMGTWRVDSTENYIVGNTTYILHDANPQLPAFTLTTIGLGHWVIGGYSPCYHNQGHEMAEMVYNYLDKKRPDAARQILVDGTFRFDMRKMKEYGLSDPVRVKTAEQVNASKGFIEEHKEHIFVLLGVFGSLVLLVLGIGYYAFRMRRLSENLIASKKQLLKAKEMAEEANKLKSAFLANMSHEIRTPLNAIVGFSQVLTSGEFSPSEQKEFCDIIKTNSDFLLELIGDVLDISRIESGYIKMTLAETDVVEVVNHSILTVKQVRKTNAGFRTDMPVERCLVNTDARRLKQVLVNLLTNAAKFTSEGFIQVSLEVDEEAHQLRFAVTDTGCGVPPEKAEKIFERFEKLNEFVQGTGLGLSISRVIVEKLGGKIWLDTDYRDGARFVFTHPL